VGESLGKNLFFLIMVLTLIVGSGFYGGIEEGEGQE
jgi:hypothetical protein